MVFIVEDDSGISDALANLLAVNKISARAYSSAEAFLSDMPSGHPGCLVLDVQLPGMSGPELQMQLAARGIRLPVIFLTGHPDVRTSVQVLKAGALDYLEKPVAGAELLKRVRGVLGEEVRRHKAQASARAIQQRFAQLTARERQVMALLVAGRSGRDIAQHLKISHRTLEVHRGRVMRKTGASTLLQLSKLVEKCRLYGDDVTHLQEDSGTALNQAARTARRLEG